MQVKVHNAKQDKHYKHPLAHDVSTTAEWGHMQPLISSALEYLKAHKDEIFKKEDVKQ